MFAACPVVFVAHCEAGAPSFSPSFELPGRCGGGSRRGPGPGSSEVELEAVVVAAFLLVQAVCFPFLVVEVGVEVEVEQVGRVYRVCCLLFLLLCLLGALRSSILHCRRQAGFRRVRPKTESTIV